MSLMILFLYKCIKVVVINILKCVYVQSDLFNLFVSIYYKLVCVNYASLCSAVFRCLCQYTSDETFNRCFSLSLSLFLDTCSWDFGDCLMTEIKHITLILQ